MILLISSIRHLTEKYTTRTQRKEDGILLHKFHEMPFAGITRKLEPVSLKNIYPEILNKILTN